MPILLIIGKFWAETEAQLVVCVVVVYDKTGMFTFNLKHTNNFKMSKKLQEDIFKTPQFDVLNTAQMHLSH